MIKFSTLLLFIVFLFQEAKAQIDFAFPPGDTSVCSGDTVVFIITTSPEIHSIRWQFASNSSGPWDTLINGVSGDTTTMLKIFNLQLYNGKYFRAVAIDAGLVVDSSDSAKLTVWDFPLPTINPPSLTLCVGAIDTLDAGTGFVFYKWNNDSTKHFISVPSEPKTYSVTVTDQHGCTGSTSAEVIENPLPEVSIMLAKPEFCEGDSILFEASQGDYDYLWANGEMSQSIFVKDDVSYSVTVTDKNNGCKASASDSAIVNHNPIAGFTTMPFELENSFIDVEQKVFFIDASIEVSTESPITNWKWNFGAFAEPETYDSANSPGTIEVKYTQGGDKKAVLKVTDIKGCMHADSIRFLVISDSLPSVQMILIQQAICLGDKMIIEVSVKTLDKPNYKVLPMIELSIHNGSGIISLLNIITSNDENYIARYCIVYDQIGNPEIEAIGFQQHKSTSVIVSDTVVREFNSGSAIPHVYAIVPSSPFLCRGDSVNFDLFISPMEDAEINYTINNVPFPQGMAINGHLLIDNVSATIGIDQIVLNITSIDLDNGCKNDTLNSSITVDVKPKPVVIVDKYTEACQGTRDSILAIGADTYLWFNRDGILASDTDFLIIPTEMLQTLTYRIEGTKDGCTTIDSLEVKVVPPPNPVISGADEACIGQVITYTSNALFGNKWTVVGGDTLNKTTESVLKVKWSTSGIISLQQKVSDCINSTSKLVTISNEHSPPYDSLEYLKGGGILLYPNPGLIPGLCYEWYKDNVLLQDHFQGCVVGKLDPTELEKFSVKVYYCGQDTGCAQLITYRTFQEEPEPTEFNILVVPNPNSGTFSLKYDILDTGNYDQYIFNSSGQLVQRESILLEGKEGSLDLSLPNSSAGLYFIKLINSITGDYRVVPFSILK
jgi:hypothetical protein